MDHDIGLDGRRTIDPMADEETATAELYRLFSASGELLYVGISLSSAMGRLRRHRADQLWWGEVAITTVEHVPRDRVKQLEIEAIGWERPRYNKHHNPVHPPTARGVRAQPNLVTWEHAATLLPIDPGELGFLVTVGHIRKVEILGAEFLRGDDIAKIIDEGLPGEAFGLNRLTA